MHFTKITTAITAIITITTIMLLAALTSAQTHPIPIRSQAAWLEYLKEQQQQKTKPIFLNSWGQEFSFDLQQANELLEIDPIFQVTAPYPVNLYRAVFREAETREVQQVCLFVGSSAILDSKPEGFEMALLN